MSKLDELEKLADAATTFCGKCGYLGKDHPTHPNCDYMATPTLFLDVQTVKQMIALIWLQHEQLRLTTINLRKGMSRSIQNLQATENRDALAAYEEFNK